jgi:thioredoxin reductase/Pyruvate/2-oxoacid:ferredoxin oxidoreductase delta subunit
MDTALTTLGFFLLTAWFIYRHLRHAAPAGAAPVQVTRPCPRCRHQVPRDSIFCPGCGVPQQIYEVVSAPVSAAGVDGAIGRAHAVVRADMCVGCGTCAAACPEPNALALKGKLAVVDRAHCVGHGECVSACPVGAIMLSTGAAVHRVEVPDIGADFQTNVSGLYIVGELGGRGLIKNAINEGKIAIENVVRAMRDDPALPDGMLPRPLDVIVVGGGPAGLSAGLEAHRSKLRYLVLEQGSLADTVRKYPRHKVLFAEPLRIPLYGDLWIADASKESLLQVWETIVANTGLHLKTGHKVDSIIREGDVFRVIAGEASFFTRRVVLAMGRRGSPRRLNVPGEELDKVFYDIAEMEDFKGRRVLVVGGGDSAIEAVLGLANQPGTRVSLSYRGPQFTRLKERNRLRLETALQQKKLALYLDSQLREIRQDRVALDFAGQSLILPNDDVIIRIGGDAPFAFLQKLGIAIVQKDLPLVDDLARAG